VPAHVTPLLDGGAAAWHETPTPIGRLAGIPPTPPVTVPRPRPREKGRRLRRGCPTTRSPPTSVPGGHSCSLKWSWSQLWRLPWSISWSGCV